MTIEEKIAEVFKELVETQPNASFVYSFVYASSKDVKTAEPVGRANMNGSKEEIETHLEGLKELVDKQTNAKKKAKAKIYDTKKN